MIPTTMAELRAAVRHTACSILSVEVVDDGSSIRVRRRGDHGQAGVVFTLDNGRAYSRSPWSDEPARITDPDVIRALIHKAADGHFSPHPCWECDDPTFGTDAQGLPWCGCGPETHEDP